MLTRIEKGCRGQLSFCTSSHIGISTDRKAHRQLKGGAKYGTMKAPLTAAASGTVAAKSDVSAPRRGLTAKGRRSMREVSPR